MMDEQTQFKPGRHEGPCRLRSSSVLLFASLILIVSHVGATWGQDAKKVYPQEYSQSFKGKPGSAQDFALEGPDAERFVKFEPEGVRITLPAGHEGVQPEVGLATQLVLKGDFEVTIRYEILTEPTGVEADLVHTRLTLGVLLTPPHSDVGTLSRRVQRNGGPQFLSWIRVWNETAGKSADQSHIAPAKSNRDRLRMARAGTTLTYLAAEGDGEDFRVLVQRPFATDDVVIVRIVASATGPKSAFDVRVTDLQIRADAIPKPPMAPTPPKVAANLPPPTKEYAQEYFQSFKGGTARPPGWEFDGPDAEDCVRFEPTGLHLKVPPGVSRNAAPRGVKTGFGVKGDCEITLSFEVLAEPSQADAGAPVGTRLSLGVAKEMPRGDVTSVSRSLSAKSGLAFVGYSLVRKEGIAKPVQQSSNTKAGKAQTGRLRLVRSGTEVYYGGSDGIDGEFVFFRKYPFGGGDLREIRLLAGTGTDKAMLDVRITDFRIRADAIPNAPASSPAPGVPVLVGQIAPPALQTSGKGWLAIALAGGLAVTLLAAVALGAALYLRRRTPPAVVSKPAGFLTLACPVCGKKLKVKAELAGKKVKCSQCGKAVLVETDEA